MIDSEAPDAVLIAGDIYDKSVPSTEAVEILDEFLFQLSRRESAGISDQRQSRLAGTAGFRLQADLPHGDPLITGV